MSLLSRLRAWLMSRAPSMYPGAISREVTVEIHTSPRDYLVACSGPNAIEALDAYLDEREAALMQRIYENLRRGRWATSDTGPERPWRDPQSTERSQS